MTILGCALIDLSTRAVVWTGDLPSRVELRDEYGGVRFRADIDKPQFLPDDVEPTHRVVPRVLNADAPAGPSRVTAEQAAFDGAQVVVTRTYEAIEPPRRLVSKAAIVDRLIAAGILAKARQAFDGQPIEVQERWNARTAIHADDETALALFAAIGADPAVILAPE